ncbi:MAG: hypothetical protein EU547_07020 [Promethearchaeota archaeon]|nr:MAG: hypothetical protein EU547_07020 [Candidatus Lokiarchaeota archaeon]
MIIITKQITILKIIYSISIIALIYSYLLGGLGFFSFSYENITSGGFGINHTQLIYDLFFLAGFIEFVIFFLSMILFYLRYISIGLISSFTGITMRGLNYLYLLYSLLTWRPNSADPGDIIEITDMGIRIGFFLSLIPYIIIIFVTLFILLIKLRETEEDKLIIKKKILELGTQFPQLKIKEISEETGKNYKQVENVIKEMIEKKEINAEFFKSSKSISFDQKANIREIDNLMELYKEGEKREIGKE